MERLSSLCIPSAIVFLAGILLVAALEANNRCRIVTIELDAKDVKIRELQDNTQALLDERTELDLKWARCEGELLLAKVRANLTREILADFYADISHRIMPVTVLPEPEKVGP